LVPAYHHGAEVEAFERAGARPRFYAGTADLAPHADELERLLRPSTRALHLIHNLGFVQDSPRWAAWCRERDLLLIEDCAPAWLAATGGRPAGTYGDLAVFSLYKTVALPDTGAAICSSRCPRRGRRPGSGSARLRRAMPLGYRSALALSARQARACGASGHSILTVPSPRVTSTPVQGAPGGCSWRACSRPSWCAAVARTTGLCLRS